MSTTTGLPPETSLDARNFDFEFDFKQKKKLQKYNGKTLTELFSVDVLFFATISLCGVFLEAVPLITISIHVILSTTCVLCDAFVTKSRKNRPLLTAFFVFCCTFTAWVDALFIVQTTCRYTESNARPAAFGIGTNKLTILFVLLSTHFVSIGSSLYRACVTPECLETGVTMAFIGATVATSAVYLLWVLDLGRELKLRTHVLLFSLFFILTIVDAGFTLGRTRLSKTQAWWIMSLTLFFVYLVLVINVTSVFEKFTLGAFIDDLATHPFDTLCGKLQCVGIVGVLVGLLAARVTKTCPKINETIVIGTGVRTPATLGDVEPFASVCVALCRQGLVVLPLVCSVVALFGDATPETSRFVLLLYGSSISLRFWLQSVTVQVWLFVTAASFGIVTDALIGVDILLGRKQVFLKERGQLETLAIVFVSSSAAALSLLCLSHSVSQRTRVNFLENKKMK